MRDNISHTIQKMIFSPSRVASSLVFAAAYFSTFAVAQTTPRGFGCDKYWKTASASNSIGDCFTQDHLTYDYLLTADRLTPCIVGAICILIGVLNIVVYPLFMMGRYCCQCCGGSMRRPDACCCGEQDWDNRTEDEVNQQYTIGSVICVKGCSIAVTMVSVAAMVLTIIGSGLVVTGYDTAFVNVNSIFDWADEKIAFIKSEMTVPDINGNPTLVPPLTEATFTQVSDLISPFRVQVNDFKKQYEPYVGYSNIGALCLATVPFVSVLITLLCAVFNIRRVVLCINSLFHYIFMIPFGLLGGAFLIVSVVFVDVEAERQKLFVNEPGILTYYLVPQLEAQSPFKGIEAQVSSAELSASRSACGFMVDICSDTSLVWSLADPKRVYTCSVNASSYTDRCTTFQRVSEIVEKMTILNGSPIGCANVSATEQNTKCSMAVCATQCTSDDIKKAATDIVLNLRYATAAVSAFNRAVRPLTSMYGIMIELFSRLTVLKVLADAFILAGVGLCCFTIFFLVDMFVIFRGQKRFFRLVDVVADSEPMATVTAATAAAPAPCDQVANEPADQANELAVVKV